MSRDDCAYSRPHSLCEKNESQHGNPPDDFVEREDGGIGHSNNNKASQPHAEVASRYKVGSDRDWQEVEDIEGE